MTNANANGKRPSMPVPGHEDAVKQLRTKLQYLKQLTAEVEEAKESFRSLATSIFDATDGGVLTLDFVTETGAKITVSMPDMTSDGNRVGIKDAMLERLIGLAGFDPAVHTETVLKYTLSDAWADWFEVVLKQWQEAGVTMPASGMKRSSALRLTVEGTQALHTLRKAGIDGAAEAMSSTVRKPTVGGGGKG